MNQTAATITNPEPFASLEKPAKPTITTKFGDLEIDESKIVNFVDGLYGLEQHHTFVLTSVPDWPDVFKLLQAIDDPQLSLIVLPLEGIGGPIDPVDFSQACQMLGFNEELTAVLGIVTMRAQSSNQVFTVNLKAPVLIDTESRQGRQHVFASEKYDLRHPLPVDERQGD
ncbi:MAG: flagellar assembly protein FliW [Geminicoccales bacterium]